MSVTVRKSLWLRQECINSKTAAAGELSSCKQSILCNNATESQNSAMQCRDQIANLKRLAISCGKLDIHRSCIPWREEVLALKYLGTDDCKESDRMTKRLKACKNMKFKLKAEVVGLEAEKLHWVSATRIQESADPDNPDHWLPKSPALLSLLREHHPTIYLP